MPITDNLLYLGIARLFRGDESAPDISGTPSAKNWIYGNALNYGIITYLAINSFQWSSCCLVDATTQFIVYIFMVDTCFYMLHYVSHDKRIYQQFHIQHHLCSLSSYCTRDSHWLDAMVENTSFTFPLLLPNRNGYTACFCLVFNAFWVTWLHSGRGLSKGDKVDSIVVTPHLHAIHHKYPGRTSCNYALYFTFWDRLCDTYRPCYR